MTLRRLVEFLDRDGVPIYGPVDSITDEDRLELKRLARHHGPLDKEIPPEIINQRRQEGK